MKYEYALLLPRFPRRFQVRRIMSAEAPALETEIRYGASGGGAGRGSLRDRDGMLFHREYR